MIVLEATSKIFPSKGFINNFWQTHCRTCTSFTFWPTKCKTGNQTKGVPSSTFRRSVFFTQVLLAKTIAQPKSLITSFKNPWVTSSNTLRKTRPIKRICLIFKPMTQCLTFSAVTFWLIPMIGLSTCIIWCTQKMARRVKLTLPIIRHVICNSISWAKTRIKSIFWLWILHSFWRRIARLSLHLWSRLPNTTQNVLSAP